MKRFDPEHSEVPEDPVVCSLKQFGGDDVGERRHGRCTVRTPVEQNRSVI